MNDAILRAKLNLNSSTNYLHLLESVIQSVTGRQDILHAMAEELGHVAIPLPGISDVSLPRALAAGVGKPVDEG